MENQYVFENPVWEKDSLDGRIYTVGAVVNGKFHSIPKDMTNTMYAELIRQRDEEGLVIADPV